MDGDFQRAVSFLASRMNQRHHQTKDAGGGFLYSGKLSQYYTTMRIIWKRGLIRLVLTAGILWMMLILAVLLFHVWSCQSSVAFFSGCPIPIADYPNKVAIPNTKSPEKFFQRLSYIMEDNIAGNGSQYPLFGGHQTLQQREESFKIKPTMRKVTQILIHIACLLLGPITRSLMAYRYIFRSCEHVSNVNYYRCFISSDALWFYERWRCSNGFNDVKYMKKCRFVFATGIFDAYGTPHQPSNISQRSQDLFCFLMVVDEVSLGFIKENVTVKEDIDGGLWVGIWRLILLKNQPYDEPRRNGKVPKILTHWLFPEARYSIWIDGKMELIVDLTSVGEVPMVWEASVCHCSA